MRVFERTLVDGNGKAVRVRVEFDDAGSSLERAILRLANKARATETGKAR